MNIPLSSDIILFKRPDELARFVRSIRFHESEIFPPITGPVGSGKRALALHFVQEYHHHYDFIFWLPAATKQALNIAYQKIAKAFKIEASLHSPSTLISSIQTQLSNYRCLYIFNNTLSFTMLQSYFPPKGHMIMISPNSTPTAWPRSPFYIAPFTKEEIIRFIAHHEEDNLSSAQDFSSLLPLLPPYPLAIIYTLKFMKHHCMTLENLISTIKMKSDLFWALSKNPENRNHYYQFIRHLLNLSNALNRSPPCRSGLSDKNHLADLNPSLPPVV